MKHPYSICYCGFYILCDNLLTFFYYFLTLSSFTTRLDVYYQIPFLQQQCYRHGLCLSWSPSIFLVLTPTQAIVAHFVRLFVGVVQPLEPLECLYFLFIHSTYTFNTYQILYFCNWPSCYYYCYSAPSFPFYVFWSFCLCSTLS